MTLTEITPAYHILAINDDEAILRLFEDLLTIEGYRVSLDTFSHSTSLLLDTIRQMQPDLVILDFIIGGESKGWQLLQAMKMDRQTRDIPVIVCTAAVTVLKELSTHLLSMKVRAVLKPFDIDYLLEIVRDVWSRGDHLEAGETRVEVGRSYESAIPPSGIASGPAEIKGQHSE